MAMQSQDAKTELKLIEYTNGTGLAVACIDSTYEVWSVDQNRSGWRWEPYIWSFYSFTDTDKTWLFKTCYRDQSFVDPLLQTQGSLNFMSTKERLPHTARFMLTILGLDVRWDQLLSIYKEVCLKPVIHSLDWVQARTYISDQFAIPVVDDAKVPEWFKRNHLYKTMKEHWQK